MNLGQFLTAKSPLSSGTVAQHLAAIAASVGTGSGETIFASCFSVTIEQDEITVQALRRTEAAAHETKTKPIVSLSPDEKSAYVFCGANSVVAKPGAREIFLSVRQARHTFKTPL